MLHSLLITGADLITRKNRAEKLSKIKLLSSPDILVLEPDPSITIKQVRQIEKFLSRKAYQADQKIVFLPEAEKLTLPAQHALLKTLEEPPANSLIILTSPHPRLLLPTIISRCQTIKISDKITLTPQQIKQQQQLFNQITSASIGSRINLAQQHSPSKESALIFCQQQLTFLAQQPADQKINRFQLLRRLNQAINQLQANVNRRLCLENLFFHYPKA